MAQNSGSHNFATHSRHVATIKARKRPHGPATLLLSSSSSTPCDLFDALTLHPQSAHRLLLLSLSFANPSPKQLGHMLKRKSPTVWQREGQRWIQNRPSLGFRSASPRCWLPESEILSNTFTSLWPSLSFVFSLLCTPITSNRCLLEFFFNNLFVIYGFCWKSLLFFKFKVIAIVIPIGFCVVCLLCLIE